MELWKRIKNTLGPWLWENDQPSRDYTLKNMGKVLEMMEKGAEHG